MICITIRNNSFMFKRLRRFPLNTFDIVETFYKVMKCFIFWSIRRCPDMCKDINLMFHIWLEQEPHMVWKTLPQSSWLPRIKNRNTFLRHDTYYCLSLSEPFWVGSHMLLQRLLGTHILDQEYELFLCFVHRKY